MQLAKSGPRRPNWPERTPGAPTNVRRAIIVGFCLIAAAIGGFGLWGATVPIASGVVANGQVVVASKRKHVQHPTGGSIRALHVDDGAVVKAGAILVELDDADAFERYTRTRDSFFLAMGSEARLQAESLDQDAPAFPPEMMNAALDEASVRAILVGQSKLFEIRRIEMRGQLSIIEEQHKQMKDELAGLEAERRAAAEQLEMTRQELKTVEELFEKGYTTRTRLYSLKRDIAQLSGVSGRTTAAIARVKSAMMEIGLKLVQARNQVQTAVQSELRDVQAKIPNLRDQYRAAKLAYERMTIRAPVSGTVMGARHNTIGAVVKPGDTVLEIVPANDRLMVEVQVRPTDIDSIRVGLDTEIQLTGLNQRKTEPLVGRVSHVSADAFQDARTNATYFVAYVDVPQAEIRRLGTTQLQPGMPAAVMIKTGERTALAYLTEPLTDSINRAWRE
jgi:HlyD family type I secretion membrane fusion protein